MAARTSNSQANATSSVPAFEGVLFAYVDNSNVWIEGQRIQAVKQGLARDPYDAMNRRISAPWSYDFGRLYELVCPLGTRVGRSILVGSRPPPNDSVCERARSEGFEVEVFNRNVANKEKQVDSSIVTTMLDDSYEHMKSDRGDMAALVAGDGDYIPSVRSLQRRGLQVRIVFWKHATSRKHSARVLSVRVGDGGWRGRVGPGVIVLGAVGSSGVRAGGDVPR
jgi:NYN domain